MSTHNICFREKKKIRKKNLFCLVLISSVAKILFYQWLNVCEPLNLHLIIWRIRNILIIY